MVKKMKKSQLSKKVMAGIGVVIVAGSMGIGAVGNQLMQPEPIDIEVINQSAFNAGVASVEPTVKIVNETVIETIYEDVIVEKNVTVEKEVLVDNGKLDMVLDRLEDMKIFDDAKEIVEEIESEDEAIKMAVEKIREELSDEDFVEDELVDKRFLEDEDEFSIKKIYDEYDDIEIVESDFDDKEYEFIFKVKLDDEEADEKIYLNFTVSVEDDEAKIVDIERRD